MAVARSSLVNSFVAAALLLGACTLHRQYRGPLAIFPTETGANPLPIRDPLLKPSLEVWAEAFGREASRRGGWFVADSGASVGSLPRSMARELGVSAFARGNVVDASGGRKSASVGVVPQVRLGNWVVSDVIAGIETDMALLGQSILRHAPWEVSWSRGTLTLGASPWTDGPAAIAVPLKEDAQHHVDTVDVHIAGQPVAMLLDTGATLSALPEALAVRLGLPSRAFDGFTTTAAGALRIDRVFVAELVLGSQRLSGVAFAAIPGNTVQGLLGLDVLSQFDFQVQPARRLLLRPLADPRQTARERVERWEFMPKGCASVGCVQARITLKGEVGQLELERERELPDGLQLLLACADPAQGGAGKPLAQQLGAKILPRPRWMRDFKPESETPSISAASFCVSPSSSVRVIASR